MYLKIVKKRPPEVVLLSWCIDSNMTISFQQQQSEKTYHDPIHHVDIRYIHHHVLHNHMHVLLDISWHDTQMLRRNHIQHPKNMLPHIVITTLVITELSRGLGLITCSVLPYVNYT
jgi:hypothetical protein